MVYLAWTMGVGSYFKVGGGEIWSQSIFTCRPKRRTGMSRVGEQNLSTLQRLPPAPPVSYAYVKLYLPVMLNIISASYSSIHTSGFQGDLMLSGGFPGEVEPCECC